MNLSAEIITALATDPPGLVPARNQMAISLGWHIILACFGVALPAMIFVVHWRGVMRDDADALELAKRWSKVSAVLFAIGAVSGTVATLQALLIAVGIAAVLVVPALGYLYVLTQSERWTHD